MLLSIHIPKTGGTKFLNLIEEIYAGKLYKDYGTERDLVAARTCPEEIRANRRRFEKEVSCIHGHYHYLKYKGLFSREKIAFVLRDPVDRVVSQYRHIALHGEESVERHRLIMSGQMDIVQFSKFRFIGNAQALYLEGIDFDRADYFPLFLDDFENSLYGFLSWLRLDPNRYQEYLAESNNRVNSREGVSLPSGVIPFDSKDLEKVRENCRQDYDLYRYLKEKGRPKRKWFGLLTGKFFDWSRSR